MGIKWENIMENEKEQFRKMTEADKFRYFLILQFGSPYGWGNETPERSDCSGAVCMALYAATGLFIRTTADDLLKRVFTRNNPKLTDIRAVFYVTKKAKKHGERNAPAGTAVHVAGFVDDGVILNSQSPCARLRRVGDVSDWYFINGHEIFIRGLDRNALDYIAREGKTRYGIDENFGKYFDLSTTR